MALFGGKVASCLANPLSANLTVNVLASASWNQTWDGKKLTANKQNTCEYLSLCY